MWFRVETRWKVIINVKLQARERKLEREWELSHKDKMEGKNIDEQRILKSSWIYFIPVRF